MRILLLFTFTMFHYLLHFTGQAPSESTVLSYDLRTNNTNKLTDMPIANYEHSCSLVGRDIWVVGGYNNGNKVLIFNLDTEQWREGGYDVILR